ncbi:MAG: DeoR/GlpR family transcriptional regulator [Desulfovermiculus sp.]|nr:DeoR/GlpR family transcriptional regulator [Desulfovermiculus sp.]
MSTPGSPQSGLNDPAQSSKPGKRFGSVQERHQAILKLVNTYGFMSIEELAHQFALTPQTIRRDINVMDEHGLLQRYHGGAGMRSSVENVAYSTRQILCLPEKKRIARRVAECIPDQASLFINIGTTTEEVARALLGHHKLRVITNNLNVAMTLSAKHDFEIIVAGGQVRNRDRGIIGEATIDFINQFKVDFGIIGISGIDDQGCLLDFDFREVRAARAIMDNSRQIFLATDHTKFGRNAMVRLGHVAEIHALFTDRKPPDPLVQIVRKNEVALHIG